MESFLEHFLVEAGAVEPGPHGELDIFLQGRITRSCPDPIRIEALIQDETEVIGFVVQIDLIALNVDFPHARITLDMIQDLS